MPEPATANMDINSKDDAIKHIRDLRIRLERGEADQQEVLRRLDRLDQAVQVIHERGAPLADLGSNDRELVARYSDIAGKPMLRGFVDEEGVYTPGLLDDTPRSDLQADLQRAVDDRAVIISVLHGIDRHKGRPARQSAAPKCDQRVLRLVRGLPGQLREEFERAWADTAGYGAEFVPDALLPTYERDIKLEWERRVPGLFQEVQAETPIKYGLLTNGWQVYLQGDVTGDDPGQIKSSSGTTSDTTVAFKTLAARAQISESATEDAILPIMDAIIRPGLVLAVASGEEDAILNGDTTATHADTGIATWNPDSFWPAAPGGLSIDHRRAWIGLRHRAGDVSNSGDWSTWNVKVLLTGVANLAGPMARPEDTVGIFSKLGFVANCMADTTSTQTVQIRTIDQYAGSGLPLIPGEIARVGGVPILISQFMTSDLNASGIYDGSTTTYTGSCIVRRNRFKRIVRRGLRIEVDKDITRGIFNLVATTRRNFITIGPSAEKNVYYGYKMAKS